MRVSTGAFSYGFLLILHSTVDARGSWHRGVVLRWTLLLLVQSVSQEQEEAMQRQALQALSRVIDSVPDEETRLLEIVEECCAREHLGIDSVRQAEPFNGKGESGWCFWRQERENNDLISVCRCLFPWKRRLVHPPLLCLLKEPIVLQRMLKVKWSIEWSPKRNSVAITDGWKDNTSSVASEEKTTSAVQPHETSRSIQSDAFLLEFDSLARLLRHKPSLFPSLSPSYVLNHSFADMNRQLEEAKKGAKDEDGGNCALC